VKHEESTGEISFIGDLKQRDRWRAGCRPTYRSRTGEHSERTIYIYIYIYIIKSLSYLLYIYIYIYI
jgi:hypothetical protein